MPARRLFAAARGVEPETPKPFTLRIGPAVFPPLGSGRGVLSRAATVVALPLRLLWRLVLVTGLGLVFVVLVTVRAVLFVLTFLSVILLAATSFYAVLVHGVLEGWLLLLHTATSGAFLVLFVVLAIAAAGAESRAGAWRRAVFGLLLASGIATAVPMLLGMHPLFGTDGFAATSGALSIAKIVMRALPPTM